MRSPTMLPCWPVTLFVCRTVFSRYSSGEDFIRCAGWLDVAPVYCSQNYWLYAVQVRSTHIFLTAGVLLASTINFWERPGFERKASRIIARISFRESCRPEVNNSQLLTLQSLHIFETTSLYWSKYVLTIGVVTCMGMRCELRHSKVV